MNAPGRKRFADKLGSKKVAGAAFTITECRRKGMFGQRRAFRQWLTREQRWEIINAYFQKLEIIKGTMAEESDLPYPKGLIRLAIFQEILENPNTESRNQLEIAYVQLESFIPYEERRIIADFKAESSRIEEMADTGDPMSIINSVNMIRKGMGDLAVSIQEKISEKMRQRLAQIRKIGQSEFAAASAFHD